MLKAVVTRLATMLATLLVTSFILNAAVYAAPGSPLDVIIGNRTVDAATRSALEHQYGLDKPMLIQYFDWLAGVVTGDFGKSTTTGASVSSLMTSRAATSLLLVVMATVLTIAAGLLLGTAAAVRGGRTDRVLSSLTSFFLALPAFIGGAFLLFFFSVTLGWFPSFGPGSGLLDRIWHLTLPALALALSLLAHTARVTRASLSQEMHRPHVETARVRGFSRAYVLRRHIFRNAMVPIVTIGGLTLASMLGAAVVVEQVFQLNGLGSLLVTAVGQNDLPVVQGVGLVIVTVFVVVNTLVDVTYPMLDPRLRGGAP